MAIMQDKNNLACIYIERRIKRLYFRLIYFFNVIPMSKQFLKKTNNTVGYFGYDGLIDVVDIMYQIKIPIKLY